MADYWGWRPYVPVATRRRNAAREVEKRRKQGLTASPVVIQGRAIVKTFWGKAWCENLERYSDFANRLPRGRTYVRNGSVVDLQIGAGAITALVSGSELYEVEVKITPVAKARWKSICADCAGAIDSLVELLQGRFSKGVMERVCMQGTGLFPSPREITLSCSCPDGAYMCKHIAAVLYGVGARLDQKPELLFRLHSVNEEDLITKAGAGAPLTKEAPAASKVLGGDDLAGIFGLEMAQSVRGEAAPPEAPAETKAKTRKPRTARKPGVKSKKATGKKVASKPRKKA